MDGPKESYLALFQSVLTEFGFQMSRKLQMSLSMASDDEVRASRRNFNPSRLTLVRKRKGWTKSELAKQVGVDLRSVVAYELGEYVPSKDTLTRILDVSGFPIGFFYGEDLDEPNAETASFRSFARMSSSQRDMALSQGTI